MRFLSHNVRQHSCLLREARKCTLLKILCLTIAIEKQQRSLGLWLYQKLTNVHKQIQIVCTNSSLTTAIRLVNVLGMDDLWANLLRIVNKILIYKNHGVTRLKVYRLRCPNALTYYNLFVLYIIIIESDVNFLKHTHTSN